MTINVLKHSGFYVENELCLRGRIARRAVGRWMGGKCSSPEQGWQWFEQVCQHWRRWFCLLSYHFSGLLSQGLGEHCLWHNEMLCLSLQPFYSEAPICTTPCISYSLYVSSSINLCATWFLLTFYLSWMDLFVCLVGWS